MDQTTQGRACPRDPGVDAHSAHEVGKEGRIATSGLGVDGKSTGGLKGDTVRRMLEREGSCVQEKAAYVRHILGDQGSSGEESSRK